MKLQNPSELKAAPGLKIETLLRQAEITVQSPITADLLRVRGLLQTAAELNEQLAAGSRYVPEEYVDNRLRIRKVRNRLMDNMK
mgnify:CR=1 FL=1